MVGKIKGMLLGDRLPTKTDLVFLVVQLVAVFVVYSWSKELPSPGYSVGVLAVLAALMSVHTEMPPFQKVLWLLLIGAFLFVEFRAIDWDRAQLEFKETINRMGEREQFRQILWQDQQHFQETLRGVVTILTDNQKAQHRESKQFAEVLGKEEGLFRNNEQLFESLNGKLFPANDPTPSFTGCGGVLPPSQYLVLTGNNNSAHVFNKFPHKILVWTERAVVDELVQIDAQKDGSMTLSAMIKDAEKRVVIEGTPNGFTINPRYVFLITRPDKSSLLVQDEYGKEVLSVRYMNPHVIKVNIDLTPIGLDIRSEWGNTCGNVAFEYSINAPLPVLQQ